MTTKPWTHERAATLARHLLRFVAVPGEEPGETRPPTNATWSQLLRDVESLEAVASAGTHPDSQTWSEEEANTVLRASNLARERGRYELANQLHRIAEGMAMLPDAARSAPVPEGQ